VFLVDDLPVLNEAFMISSGLSIAAGWYYIRRRRVDVHRRLMLAGTALAAAFFAGYALRTLLVGDTSFGGPAGLRPAYMGFLQAHSLLATVAAVLGVVTLRRALRGRFAQHRRIGPWTASLWFVTVATGLVVFMLLYVLFPPGPTTDLWRAVGAR
jgi:putative membrane protein